MSESKEAVVVLSSLDRVRIIDLCFRAFMNAREPNKDDGGATDWFNDTLPALKPGIDAFNAHISTLQCEADETREALALCETALTSESLEAVENALAAIKACSPQVEAEKGSE